MSVSAIAKSKVANDVSLATLLAIETLPMHDQIRRIIDKDVRLWYAEGNEASIRCFNIMFVFLAGWLEYLHLTSSASGSSYHNGTATQSRRKRGTVLRFSLSLPDHSHPMK